MNLRRLTRADVAIGVALLLLLLAVLRPMLTARGYQSTVMQATEEVDVLRAAALDRRSTSGSWPETADFVFDDFTLEWTRLDVIEFVEAPPASFTAIEDDEEPDTSVPPSGAIGDLPPDSVGPEMAPSVREVGAIVLRTGNESLLADLLERYGSTVSYVRDSTWTLIVDDRSGSTP